jgi:hypothetical protein
MAIVVPEAPAGRPPAATGVPTPPGTPVGETSQPGGAPGPTPGSTWTADREARRAARGARRGSSADASRAGFIGGLVLIVIGAIFLIRQVVPWFDWDLWWPIGLILLGGLLLVLALRPQRSTD